ncbi:HORMA domain-containing protein [Polychytrium aggregatum]|uniref:HORMA domain-containing protein n=1 Tax=Polychytrium aggregatum TaxID=110093 RepID=UPI0022FF1DCE|nr:HORMA domain-containing protein [Polychytrium aggregatum]KAI9203330.1 HORMA domain-containing protein [Polychytrium aggregatum]
MTTQVQKTPVLPTFKQSLNLVQNLLGTSIGAITYLRMLFPEENYKDTSLNGLAIKSLRRDYSFEADELIDWIEHGVYDALEKRYLKTMVFFIFYDPSDPCNIIESYTFSFSYPSERQMHVSFHMDDHQVYALKTKDEIMKATSEMLRRLLVLTQTLKPLPESAYISIRLFYYDEVTPSDYEPPCFRPESSGEQLFFPYQPEKIRIGDVLTPFHAVNLQIRTATDSLISRSGKSALPGSSGSRFAHDHDEEWFSSGDSSGSHNDPVTTMTQWIT